MTGTFLSEHVACRHKINFWRLDLLKHLRLSIDWPYKGSNDTSQKRKGRLQYQHIGYLYVGILTSMNQACLNLWSVFLILLQITYLIFWHFQCLDINNTTISCNMSRFMHNHIQYYSQPVRYTDFLNFRCFLVLIFTNVWRVRFPLSTNP